MIIIEDILQIFSYFSFYEARDLCLIMVLAKDGKSEHVAHILMKIGLIGEKIRFLTALDLIECLNLIK